MCIVLGCDESNIFEIGLRLLVIVNVPNPNGSTMDCTFLTLGCDSR